MLRLLSEIQTNLFKKHETFTREHTFEVDRFEDIKSRIDQGFVLAPWDGTKESAEKIQEDLKATIRCLPFGREDGKVLFAKSY